jgi:hypothetical protein
MKAPPGPEHASTPVAGIDKSGRTPLWYHAANGDVAKVRAELAGGADPSFGDSNNYSPLHVAVQNGWTDVIQLLIEAGADPNKTDTHGNNPLWTAVLSAPKHVKVEIITQLLWAGANPDHKSRADKSPRDAANTIAGGIEVPFAGVEKRSPERAEESKSIMDERTEIPVQDDPDAIARWVWNNLVPGSGQSSWVQGELLRCVEKFRWEAQNNGNGNWDRQFKMMADYLEKTLCSEPAFSDEARASIREDIAILRRFKSPYTEDDLYDRLIAHVVEYCRLHPSLRTKPRNPEINR